MKKSLVALAALAVAGIASAQSSVTLFGVLDTGVRYTQVKVNGVESKAWALASGGITTSRLGFRGTEDLGGGLAASFWLEAGLAVDTGLGNGGRNTIPAIATLQSATDQGTDNGFNFNRRSTVSLSGGFGEIRMGRDFNTTYLNDTNFDPFATTGLGGSIIDATRGGYTLGATAAGSALGNNSYVRTNNAISYFLPSNLGGFYGQVQYAFAEIAKVDGAARNNSGRNVGGRFGYANGPLDVAVAYGQTDLGASNAATALDTTSVKELNLGASYDFGIVKAFGEAVRTKIDNDLVALNNNNNAYGFLLGATAPVGPGLVRLAYSQIKYSSDLAGADPRSRKLAVGYIHNLSKRTALYTNYARVITNGQAGLQSTGFDVGLRHAF
ncbi:MAG: porin [Janthinobacterium lividum]